MSPLFGSGQDLTLRGKWDGSDLDRGLERLDDKLDRLDRKKIDPKLDTRRLGQADAGVQKLNGSMLRLVKTAAAFALPVIGVTAFIAGAKRAVNAASDLEETLNKTRQVFRDSAPEMLRWSQNAATALGLTRTAALDGAASIGAMLIPMGFADAKAADMSRTMAQLAADMASFNNEDPSEMLDRIRAGLAGESEPLRRYGVDLRVAALEQLAVRDGLIDVGEKLQGATMIQAAYNKILNDTKRQQGDFRRTSDGLANSQRTLNAQIEELSAAFGELLLPGVTKMVSYFNRTVIPDMRQWAEELATIWDRDDIGPEKKVKESWEALKRTGLPGEVGDAMVSAFVEVMKQAPARILAVWEESPLFGKAVIAALLWRKFGPAATLIGTRLGRVLGAGTAAGAGVGAGAGLGRGLGGPVPVFVTNPGFMGAGPGGATRAAAGGRAAAATRATRLARFGGFAGAHPLGLAAGLLVGGVALDRSGLGDRIFGIDEEADRKRARERTERLQKEILTSWERGGPGLRRAVAESMGLGSAVGEGAAGAIRDTKRAIQAFKEAWREARPDLRREGRFAVRSVMEALEEMPQATRDAGAASIIKWAQGMEEKGRLATGATRGIIAAIRREYGELPPAIEKNISRVNYEQARLRLDQAKTVKETRAALSALRSAYAEFARTHGIPTQLQSARALQRRAQSGEIDPGAELHTGGILPGASAEEILVQALPGERIITRHQTAALDAMLGGRGAVDRVISGVRRHHSFDIGGTVTEAARAIGGIVSQAANALPRRRIPGATRVASLSQALYNRTRSATADRLDDLMQRATLQGSYLTGFTGGGSAALNRGLGQRMAAGYGWTGAQWTALDRLWQGESGWNHMIANRSSGAYGIPQSLPASKMAAAGADWRTNPATQISWGLNYIRGRYGTPAAAYSAWLSRSPHWYHRGGAIPSFDHGGNVLFGSPGGDTWQAGLARQFGLSWSGTRSPSRNRAVGGSSTSRHLVPGGAGDFSGTPSAMLALARWAYNEGHTPFAEIFYDPWGQWDNGRYSASGIGGHSDHVHLSYGRSFSLGAAPMAGSSGRASATARRSREGPEGTPFTISRDTLASLGFPRRAAGMARRVVRPVPDISSGSDPGLTPGQERLISRVGREARQAGRERGVRDPEELSRIETQAERDEEIRILRGLVGRATTQRNRLKTKRLAVWRDFIRVGRRRVRGDQGARDKKILLMRRYRAQLAAFDREIAEVREEIAQLNARLMDIGEEIAAEADVAAFVDPGGGGAETSPEAQFAAQAEQARQEERDRQAGISAARSAVAGSIVSTITGAGSIAPGVGDSRPIIVNVEGSLVREGELAGWLSELLAAQPARPATTYRTAI